MTISDLAQDWGGFEEFVKKLHETGEVHVERNVFLEGRSGARRQIDVLIRHKQGLYEHRVIAECKYWNSAVERLHVDALATTIRELGASRGVIFSTKGFQSGAITQAEHENIDLFVVRELSDEEWGLPGRVVDIFLHVIQPGIANVASSGASKIGNPLNTAEIRLNFEFGGDGPVSNTPTLKPDGSAGRSVEEHIFESAHKALIQALGAAFTINGGETCTRYMLCPVNMILPEPFRIPHNGELLIIPNMSFDLGIKISQSRITVDRAKQYQFAVAVENRVNGNVSAASRRVDASSTTVAELVRPEISDPNDVLKNGAVMRVILKALFPMSEMSGLSPIPPNRPGG